MLISPENIERVLNSFADYVIQQSRSNLTKGKINASKSLYKSFEKDVKVSENSIGVSVNSDKYNDYGKFIDRGVKGKQSGSSLDGWAYTTKKPPADVFIKWSKVKPIKPRDKKTGKFITDKQFGFIMRNHIFNHGIKPTKFLTTPFERAFKSLPDELVDAYGLDVESFLKFIVKK